jgi:hypothetical protein
MRWPGLAVRLAARNLRRRPGEALLLLLTLTIATGVLGVAMSLYGSAEGPWNRTWGGHQRLPCQLHRVPPSGRARGP